MATLTKQTGLVMALANFLNGFTESWKARETLENADLRTQGYLDRAELADERARMNRELQVYLTNLRHELQMNEITQRNTERMTNLPTELGLRSQSQIDTAKGLKDLGLTYAPLQAEQARETYEGLTPLVENRARRVAGAQTGARIEGYQSRGLKVPGTTPGGGALGGLIDARLFAKMGQAADNVVKQAANAELNTKRGFGGTMMLGPGEADSLIAFNPRRQDEIRREALLSQIKPYVDQRQYTDLVKHLNTGGSFVDAFFPDQGFNLEEEDTTGVEDLLAPPPEEPLDYGAPGARKVPPRKP